MRIWVHPCRRCGACCATFRVSFYWAEAGDEPPLVPEHLTEQLTAQRAVMRGTNQPKPRCVALDGEIGGETTCTIHPRRSSVCRDFEASWEQGQHNPRCDDARASYALAPLKPEDWDPSGPAPAPDPTPAPDHPDDGQAA